MPPGHLWIAAALFAVPWWALAADGPRDLLRVKSATVGFGGKFKAGFWQPVRVTVIAGAEGAKGRLELQATDGDQSPVVYRGASVEAIDLAAGEETTTHLYCKSGPIAAPINVRLVVDENVVWSHDLPIATQAMRSTQELVIGVGPPIGLEEAALTIRRRADSAVQVGYVAAAAELPDQWWAYEGVDTLVLPTSDAAFMSEINDEQRQAIVQWVLLGGRIILCVGSRGAEVASSESAWAKLIPGELVEVDALRDRSGLENFTKSELPFDDPSFQRNRPLVTRLKNVRGEVLLDEGSSSAGKPLVVHAAAGLGQVVFVGLDLDHPSLKSWKGRTRMVAALLQQGSEQQQPDRGASGIRQLGYDDLVGQLRAALDQFGGVSLVNFTTVSVLTIAYLLLIGPIDYLFLSRLNLPRAVTWVTFPAVAVIAIAVAGLVGRQVHGSRVRLNQAEIIDLDVANQIARGTVWCHVYSPVTKPFDATLDLSLPSGVAKSAPEGWLAWQGLPGDALGGLESRQPALVRRDAYSVALPGPEAKIAGLTVQVASSKTLGATWSATADLPHDSKLSLDRFGMLAGEFQAPVAVTLSECILAHDEKMYRVGTISPGQRVRMADLAPLDLEARLTRRRVEQTKDISTPWEQDSVDVPRIIQMLMFHEAARGTTYTGLTHRYQPRIDLSQHVRLGAAVLVGRASEAVARLSGSSAPLADAADTTTFTWYRIVLPVTR
jgi:hypothetical protein